MCTVIIFNVYCFMLDYNYVIDGATYDRLQFLWCDVIINDVNFLFHVTFACDQNI
jgi:hypothetical protein